MSHQGELCWVCYKKEENCNCINESITHKLANTHKEVIVPAMNYAEMELRIASQIASEGLCAICGKTRSECEHDDFDVVKASRGDLHPCPTGRIRRIGSPTECAERFEMSPMTMRGKAFKENRIDSMSAVMGAMYGVRPIESYLTQIENNIRIEQLYSKLGAVIYDRCKDNYPCGDFVSPQDFMTTDEISHMCKKCTENGICGIVKNISDLLKISVDNTK